MANTHFARASVEQISALEELDKSEHTTKSPAQLEHILFEYERNLGQLLKTLNPNDQSQFNNQYTAEERAYVSQRCEFFMAKAESIKAIKNVRSAQRSAQQEQLRLSESRSHQRDGKRRSSAASASLQEETRKRLSDARVEELNNRRRASSAATNPPPCNGTLPSSISSDARRRSFDNKAASLIARRQSPQNAPAAASTATKHVPRPLPHVPQNRRAPAQPARGQQKATPSAKYSNELEQTIVDEVLMEPPTTSWSDIAGLEDAKTALQETVILPTLRPDIFTGLRAPPKGVLLFGPPGTGKTMIARACASESGFAFFAVSASALTSKWVGEGEKMMKALFKVAGDYAPAVVFMDEIDSVLSKRKSTGEHEASRRLKTEFLVQIDGVNSSPNDPENNVLVIGATNLPFDLDDAVLRRFGRRVYVPLPDREARKALFVNLLSKNANSLNSGELLKLVDGTVNFSASDLTNLCKEASMGPLRQISMRSLAKMDSSQIPEISYSHFALALKNTQPSTSQELLDRYDEYRV